MKVAIIGAGLTGVTTAYQLAKRGCEVTVFDRQPAAAEETSFANGGQISISQPFPWNSPDVPLKVLKWIGRKDAPLVLKLQRDLHMWNWSLRYLMNARETKFYESAGKILKLALASKSALEETVQDENIKYHRETRGILKLFSTAAMAKEAEKHKNWLSNNGVDQQLLNFQECVAIEPSLAHTKMNILGGTFSPIDESGDANLFIKELVKVTERLGVDYKFNSEIDAIRSTGTEVTSIRLKDQELSFDKYVICAGSNSHNISRDLKLKLPLYPVKGYSVSIPVEQSNNAPLTSITDMENHVVISRLGNVLRAAGTAEINGYNTVPNLHRENMVLSSVQKLFPDAGGFDKAIRWCGLRPMTVDSVPIIGPTAHRNLFVNTGHGPLGWTLCSGSAKLIAEHVLNIRTELDISDYSVDRF